jgi:hypothetical protein
MSNWDVLNFITFQIWVSVTALGFIAAVWTGNGGIATIAPWVGLILGVAAEELTPGFLTEGVKIV